MEWLWSLVTGMFGWWLGHRQSVEDRKRGIEEGAQAAFDIDIPLVGMLVLECDRQRLKQAFKDVDLTDRSQVRDVALKVGEIYWRIVRRAAFDDARFGSVTDADKEEWKLAFGKEMPPVGYEEGYLQAIHDVIAGASEYAEKYFEPEVAKELSSLIDQSQRKFAGLYLDSYDPDGKVLGAQLLVETVTRTFDRAETERKN